MHIQRFLCPLKDRIVAIRVFKQKKCTRCFRDRGREICEERNAGKITYMGETLNLLFSSREDGTYELRAKESWSGRTVSGNFVPPYTNRQLNAQQKKLNNLESSDAELREIGCRLFAALCGTEILAPTASRKVSSEQPIQAVLHTVIQRTLKRRGTVALSLGFGPGCDEFVRYPWELLHNGDHFLLVSGIFTLSRALLRPDIPVGCELPVHPPMRILYIAASPTNCVPLETERSFEAMELALTPLIDAGQVFLDRLEPPTFSQLVRYLNLYGGAGMLDDSDTTIPCYVVHFDGHGAYGRLCPGDGCETVNGPDMRKCVVCGTALGRSKAQTYLCFCDEKGLNHFIDTQSLRDLFLSSDIRLAVFSACETATVSGNKRPKQQHAAVDATLATALVTAQVPAVVAMPFSLQDDLSPTFMYHFYEALADGRTLEEALSRARQALLPMLQKSWFIPVLYRHVAEGEEGPSALIVTADASGQHDHPLAHLGPPATFIGRAQELHAMDELLTATAIGANYPGSTRPLRPQSAQHATHHIALTGPGGIGKSALALEAVRRNREKFPGGIIGVSLQDGKTFAEALLEMIRSLHIPIRNSATIDMKQRVHIVQSTLRSLVSRELPCLVLVDNFEEVKERVEMENWLQFLCGLPQDVVVLVTSRSNPEHMLVVEGIHCRWYEYRLGKMTDCDLFNLFTDLAGASGLDQRIQLEAPRQQRVLHEICTLLDGYPLGAELIFGTARSIGGKVYTPEAATRSLEEVRDELRETPLAGILAVLDVSYHRLNPSARLLLSYLAAFRLPFSREQILLLVQPAEPGSVYESVPQGDSYSGQQVSQPLPVNGAASMVTTLAENWRAARDELVQASFIQFDGRVYTIHTQICHFALALLPLVERRRVHRVVAFYYHNLPQPVPEEWFAAYEHLEAAGEVQDLQEAVRVAVRASWALRGRGYAPELQAILRRAAVHTSRLANQTGEGQIQCCLGAILRQAGQYVEAEACLRSSLSAHRVQHDSENAGWALYELALLFLEEGNFSQASTYAQDALALFREAGTVHGEAWMQTVMGEVSRDNGRYYEALGHFELAFTHFQQMAQDREGQVAVWHGRGTVYAALGQYMMALRDYENAQRLCTELGLHIILAWALTDKSVVYTQLGKLDLAESACHEAIAIFRAQGLRRGEARALRSMGDIVARRQDPLNAQSYYTEAQVLFSAIGDRIDLAHVQISLGTLALQEGESLEAKEFYEQARSIALEHGVRQIEGRAICGLGDVACALQQFVDAESFYLQALTIAHELDSTTERFAILLHQGALHEQQEKHAVALDFWVQALSLDQHSDSIQRSDLLQKVNALVSEQHLEEAYKTTCERCGLA